MENNLVNGIEDVGGETVEDEEGEDDEEDEDEEEEDKGLVEESCCIY